MISGAMFVLVLCTGPTHANCHPFYFYTLPACLSAMDDIRKQEKHGLRSIGCYPLGTKKERPNVHS